MSSLLAGPFGGGFPSGNMQMITTFVDISVCGFGSMYVYMFMCQSGAHAPHVHVAVKGTTYGTSPCLSPGLGQGPSLFTAGPGILVSLISP